jgi:hypothetical protein
MLFRVKPNGTFSATPQAFGAHEAPVNPTHADHFRWYLLQLRDQPTGYKLGCRQHPNVALLA